MAHAIPSKRKKVGCDIECGTVYVASNISMAKKKCWMHLFMECERLLHTIACEAGSNFTTNKIHPMLCNYATCGGSIFVGGMCKMHHNG